MRILVVGSLRHKSDQALRDRINSAAFEIGKCLAESGHTILVGSDDPEDVDPEVVNGAISTGSSIEVEVHLMEGATECYKGLADSLKIRNKPHRYRDWDVTVHEVLRREADAVIAIAGRVGVVQSGMTGWMLGRPVLPIAAFGGGARAIWGYGSGERAEFYFGALTDQEIDSLMTWSSDSPKFAVKAIERIANAARRAKTPKSVFAVVSGLVLLALMVWVVLLAAPVLNVVPRLFPGVLPPHIYELPDGVLFAFLLISVCVAGALGALMQTLRGIREDRPATYTRIIVDVVLGVAAGLLTASLYLIAQVALNGSLVLPESNLAYTRLALIVGLAALFSSLYLDAALARFDVVRDSVMAGKFGTEEKAKP
jgi:hypothetical protein